MKRMTVKLVGNVTHWACRSFVIEVPDDVSVSTVNQQILESLADEALVPWEFGTEGLVHVTDHFVEEEQASGEGNSLITIPFMPVATVPSRSLA